MGLTEKNFEATREEIDLMSKIAARAVAELDHPDSQLHIIMDLNVAHNDIPLDFERLLEFPKFDFSHDIYGIRQHLNRDTGKIEDCFLPRCAK
jgi:hypothetical protein